MNTKLLCHNVVVFLSVTLLFSVSPSCEEATDGDASHDIDPLQLGERALVTLPLEFDILSPNRLYVDGVLIQRAHLTTEDGDSLFLNGTPILPHRPCSKTVVTAPEDTYLRIYGSVPFVQERMAAGALPSEAAHEYLAEPTSALRREAS